LFLNIVMEYVPETLYQLVNEIEPSGYVSPSKKSSK